jgi:hypothetical protein
MYSVNQHWDPLKVCIVGRTYEPSFYKFIPNDKIRKVFERIAEETEEDYQKLIAVLESFGVKVLRPNVFDDYRLYLSPDGKIIPPPMTPRDWMMMLGNKFYYKTRFDQHEHPDHFNLSNIFPLEWLTWGHILDDIDNQGNQIVNSIQVINPPKSNKLLQMFASHHVTRIGKDLYFGTTDKAWWSEGRSQLHRFDSAPLDILKKQYSEQFPDYRCHVINTLGHTDGVFSATVPGLIVSNYDISTYAETFPGWEVVYLPHDGWAAVKPFVELKIKNRGKWWVPGEELNDEFTEFVESWMGHWVGYVEESVFDVNMLVIDEKNVICTSRNEKVFKAFEERGITAHIVPFRHRYFWDGGLHCITSDIHRLGERKDFFPERI